MKIGLLEFTAALTVVSFLFGAWLFYLNRMHNKH